jgi:hypothetical protein
LSRHQRAAEHLFKHGDFAEQDVHIAAMGDHIRMQCLQACEQGSQPLVVRHAFNPQHFAFPPFSHALTLVGMNKW